jgi:hypothetical protein
MWDIAQWGQLWGELVWKDVTVTLQNSSDIRLNIKRQHQVCCSDSLGRLS